MSSEAARIEYWDFKSEGRERMRAAQPNPVHRALVELERRGELWKLATQNVDGLHARAGTTQERLLELHGTDRTVECQRCHQCSEPGPHFDYFRRTRKPPLCHCGGYLKPATISFGQSLRERDLEQAIAATKDADLVIALGSTLSLWRSNKPSLSTDASRKPDSDRSQGAIRARRALGMDRSSSRTRAD